MAKFRMKTVEIEAAQVCRLESKENDELLATRPPGWLFRQEKIKHWDVTDDGKIVIATLFGDQHVKPGDWIVQRSDGTLHVLSDEEFNAKYEPVVDEPAAEGEIPKRDECGSEKKGESTSITNDFQGIIRQAFKTVDSESMYGNKWRSNQWVLVLSLAREFRMDMNSDMFLDAIGLAFDTLELRLQSISDRDWPSSEGASEGAKEAEEVDGAESFQEDSSSEPLYYLQNESVGYIGNSPVFWKEGGNGYTPWVSEAQLFTFPEASKIVRSTRGTHRFAIWPAKLIVGLVRGVVDIQDLRVFSPIQINNDSTCNDRQTEQIIDANGPTN